MREDNGVSLTALTVIVIVLLFIAGIAIYFFVGHDGYIERYEQEEERKENKTYHVVYDLNGVAAEEVPEDKNEYKVGDTVEVKKGINQKEKIWIGWSMEKLEPIKVNEQTIPRFPENLLKAKDFMPEISFTTTRQVYEEENFKSNFEMPEHDVILYAVYVEEIK